MVVGATDQGEVMSIRRISRELGISEYTVYLVLKKDLHFILTIPFQYLTSQKTIHRPELNSLINFLKLKMKMKTLLTIGLQDPRT
jgi:DNA invertase Pin-like site-specific DNA recombinase